ncbi:LIM domain only protein 3 [Onthophagus taurus]|uniref:LIM domain only protein 3 n=1 Tax=Onthophagus taurus TaxID=166361 RepID=UPI000C207239|nr:LIM/homeobox protein Lhx9 isoform X2 [Onthophagus taurus]
MNTHFHSYGGPELTSPHPPSPDNNNYQHPGPGPHMHPTNGHSMGPLGHPGGPHDQISHGHHHPAFSSGGPPPGAPHHPHHASNNNNNNNTVKVCAGCGGKIMERFLLHALDRYWHNGCLKCSCCSAMLADIGSSCFTKGGMILCKMDYMRLFGSSGACAACGQTIPASDYVMRSGGSGGGGGGGGNNGGHQATAQHPGGGGGGGHVFHLKCFACSKCGAHLVPGDRYYMLSGNLVCEQDWHKLFKATAAPTVRKGKVGRPRRSRD